MFTECQLARHLGVTILTVRTWRVVRCGPLPVRVGALFLYPEDVVAGWVEDGDDAASALRDATDELRQPVGVDAPLQNRWA
jgi:hypothetical protein